MTVGEDDGFASAATSGPGTMDVKSKDSLTAEEMAYRSRLGNLTNSGSGGSGRSRDGRGGSDCSSSSSSSRRATFDPSTTASATSTMRTPSAKAFPRHSGGGGGQIRQPPATDGRLHDANARSIGASSKDNLETVPFHLNKSAKKLGRTEKGVSSYYNTAGTTSDHLLQSAVKSSRKSTGGHSRDVGKGRKSLGITGTVASSSKSSSKDQRHRSDTTNDDGDAGADATVGKSFGETTVSYPCPADGEDEDVTANINDVASVLNSSLFATRIGRSSDNPATSPGLNTSTATTSTTSSGGDTMNRSVLSDTTELTASTFLFNASSRHVLNSVTAELAAKSKNEKETEEAAANMEAMERAREVSRLALEGQQQLKPQPQQPQPQQQEEQPKIREDDEEEEDDDDDETMDWEKKEDNHMYTLEVNDMLQQIASQDDKAKDNGGDDDTQNLPFKSALGNDGGDDGSILCGSSPAAVPPTSSLAADSPRVRGTPMSTINVSTAAQVGRGGAGTSTGKIMSLPSPDMVAEQRRKTFGLDVGTPPQPQPSTTAGAGSTPFSVKSPGSAQDAKKIKRLAGSIRKTKLTASATKRRQSAPVQAIGGNISSKSANDRRKSMAIMPGGGLPLFPAHPSSRLTSTPPFHEDINNTEALSDDNTDAQGDIATLVEGTEANDKVCRSPDRDSSFGVGRASITANMTAILPPLTPVGASPASTRAPSSTGSFERAERLAEETAAMEAGDINAAAAAESESLVINDDKGKAAPTSPTASIRSTGPGLGNTPSSLKKFRLSSATPPSRVAPGDVEQEEVEKEGQEEQHTTEDNDGSPSPLPSSLKQSPATRIVNGYVDSPARNTRSASKRKSAASPMDPNQNPNSFSSLLPPSSPEVTQEQRELIDPESTASLTSPGRKGDSKRRRSSVSRKDLPSPSPKAPVFDSPARNTRSSAKRKSVSSLSPVANLNDVVAAAGDDQQDDTIMTISTASSGGSSVGHDLSNDTANTMQLKDLMAGIEPVQNHHTEEVAAIGHAKRSKKRRKSGNATDDEDESDEDDMSIRSNRRETADTFDLQELMTIREECTNEEKPVADSDGFKASNSTTTGELKDQEPTSTRTTPKNTSSSVSKTSFSKDTPESIGNKEDAEEDDQTPPLRKSVHNRSATPGLPKLLVPPSDEETYQVGNDTCKENEKQSHQLLMASSSSPPAAPSAPTVPRSILNSTRKPRDSIASMGSRRQSGTRRIVAFGSPEAAEYNVGSPSVSLTPMPSKQVRERFALPKNLNQDASMSSNDGSEPSIDLGDDNTADSDDINHIVDSSKELTDGNTAEPGDGSTADVNGIKGLLDGSETLTEKSSVNIDELIQKATDDVRDESMELSGHSPSPSETAELPDNVDDLIQGAENEIALDSPVLSPGTSSMASSQAGGNDAGEEEHTIELEGDVNAFLAAAQTDAGHDHTMMSIDASRIEKETPSHGNDSSPTDSIEMTDAQSLASMNSRPRPSSTPPEDDNPEQVNSFQSKKLNFEARLYQSSPESPPSDSDSNVANDDDRTQELDTDLAALIQNTGAAANSSPEALKQGRATSSRYSSTFVPKSNRMSFGSVAGLEPTQTIELEENMDSLIEKIDDEDSTEIEEADDANPKTLEIEGNMSALLSGMENADEDKQSKTIQFDDASTPPVLSKKKSKRRKSRFSLVPEGRISLSTNGKEVIHTLAQYSPSSTVGEESQERDLEQNSEKLGQPPIPTAEVVAKSEDIDLTFAELATAGRLLGDHSGLLDPSLDTMLDACKVATNCRSDTIVSSTNHFLSEVCRTVEENIEGSYVDEKESIEALISNNATEMLMLQRGVRSVGPNAERVKESLRALSRSVEEYVLADWRLWEIQVAEALKPSIEPASNEAEEEERKISEEFRVAEQISEAMSLMADRRVKKARRRSMCRRRTAVSKMEDELSDLEHQIESAEADLEAQMLSKQALARLSSVLRSECSAESERQLQKKQAEACRGKMNSIEKLHIWTPMRLDDSMIAVRFNDFIKDPTLVLKFTNFEQRPIKCLAELVQEQENRIVLKSAGSQKYSPSVAAFVRSRLQHLVKDVVSKKKRLTVPEMKKALQMVEWQIGRLEMAAKEVQRCISHHDGVLYRKKDGAEAVGLRFEFAGRVRVEMALAYGPLAVSLTALKEEEEEEMFLDQLRRQLLKNARSGFGSLSRAVEIISTNVKN